MRVTFVCPSAPHPIGGVIAVYEFANGLARRGHQVHLVHAPFFRNRIESMDDLSWFRFEPGVEHHVSPDATKLPDADILFGTSDEARYGLPVTIVQGVEMLHVGLEADGFRAVGLKVCIASWLVESGLRFGVAPDQFEVVAMGIDHARFRVTTPIGARPRQVGMLYSSHPAKGWRVGLEALTIAHERDPDLRAVVFGTAEPPGPLPDWITTVSHPSEEDLVELYNQCQVFVQSSDYEGFGFTAVEAMACGAALVTTDNGGSRDYAFAGETALVSPPGDAEALGRHVIELLEDDDRRQAMAEAGRRYVQIFNWDHAAADLEAALEKYLADPAAYQRPPGPELIPRGEGTDPFALR